MKKYIGVDIGGMSIKIGLVNEEGNLLAKTVVKTESDAESVIKTVLPKRISKAWGSAVLGR